MTQRRASVSGADDSTSRAFDLLSHRRRRAVLEILANRECSPTVADVARTLVAREREAPIEAVSGSAVRRAYLSLVHVHVPKLEASGAVECDRRRNTVALTERGRRLSAVADPSTDRPQIPETI